MRKNIIRTLIIAYLILAAMMIAAGCFFIHTHAGSIGSKTEQDLILLLLLLYGCSFVILLSPLLTTLHEIMELTNALRNYTQGDYSKRININRNDAIGRLGDTMNYMAQELDRKQEDQRRFISNVSHDFRSPLTSIKGYAEAMEDGTIPPEMQSHYLHIIISETERLQGLTENLLDMNRYGSTDYYLDIKVFDINKLIDEVAETFERRCEDKNLEVIKQFENSKIMVKADRDRISQVLHNLIDNAIKFSGTDSEIILGTSAKNGRVMVSVKDFGVGIPRSSLKKIWERFYKTDPSRGRDKRGTGLGLPIVKEIIQAHGENINVVSTEGAGTKFVFTLPLVMSS